jgi:hypothetical protein
VYIELQIHGIKIKVKNCVQLLVEDLRVNAILLIQVLIVFFTRWHRSTFQYI